MKPGITLPSDYARLALKVAPYILLAIFFALWWHRGDVIEREKANNTALVSMYAQRTAEAQLADAEHARTVEAAQNQAREEAYHDIDKKLAAARAAADDYVRRLRSQAGQGGGGKPDLSFTPAAASQPDGTSPDPLVDDLRACSANTVIAQGWQDWWKQISEVPR